MGELKVELGPGEVGLDPERLQRIGRHFGRYVDDGKLPGWLITVNRRGRLAYVASYGSRDLAADRPVETDTLWRIYSIAKRITSVAAMMLWEEGGFELNNPVSDYIPPFADVRCWPGIRQKGQKLHTATNRIIRIPDALPKMRCQNSHR